MRGKARSLRVVCIVAAFALGSIAMSHAEVKKASLTGDELSRWEAVGPATGSWQAKGGAFSAEAPDDSRWHLRIAPGMMRDARLETTIQIKRQCPPGGYDCARRFRDYWTGERDGGYSAALIVRYEGPKDYYRLAISPAYGDVALWKPRCGFVARAPVELAEGEAHRVALEAAGRRIRAYLDGKQVLQYWDRALPIEGGRFGLGVYNARVSFSDLSVSSVEPAGKMPARPESRFTLKKWRGNEWVFDREEPVVQLDRKALSLWNAKLLPGVRPVCYWELFWKQYDGTHNYGNHLDSLDWKGGPKFNMQWVSHNEVPPKKFVELYPELKDREIARKPARLFTVTGTMELGYDAQKESYLYDVHVGLKVDPGVYWKDTADGLEYCNLIPYNVVGPAVEMGKDAWPWWYQWAVIRAPDDHIYRHPIHHNGIRPVVPKQDGGFYAYVLNPDVNPVVEFDNPTDEWLKPYAGLCNWAYDIHFRYRPYKSQERIPSGTEFRAHYRVWGARQELASKWMDESELHPNFRTDREYAVFVRGLNDFKKGRKYAEPHPEWAWRGTWDKKVGHNDHFSLRIENKEPKLSTAGYEGGPSFFMPRYENGAYECSAWIRTENVKGKGATVYVENNDRQRSYCPVRVTGTKNWTKVSFRPDNVGARFWRVQTVLELDGQGTAWFDDVELKRLK